MKAAFESLNTGNRSFLVRKFEEKSFAAPYHFHPELELTLIVNGIGKRYVGTHMQDYFSNDLVLLGSNLPHCWKTTINKRRKSESVVIQFHENFMGNEFFLRPEMENIQKLLARSNCGIHFTGNIEIPKAKMLQALKEKKAFKKFMLLLELLNELASNKDYVLLNNENVFAALSATEMQRINKVMAYIVDNFQSAITLNKAASTIHMSTHAFCKYFKKITRKTFIEAVNDYRIDFAVKQLVHTNHTIADIGFDAGFNDISNFHKVFRKRTNLSPLNYRKSFLKKLA